MKVLGYIASIAIMLITIPIIGAIPAMILGALVAGINGLLMARAEVNEVESRVGSRPPLSTSQPHNPLQKEPRRTANKQGSFSLGGQKFSPHKFGEGAVTLSTQSASDLLKTILSNLEQRPPGDTIFTRMKARPRLAQLQVMAVHIAVYYVYVQFALGVPRDVISDVYAGISEDIGSWLSDHTMAIMVESAVRAYGQALYSELSTAKEDIGFDINFGPTAYLAFEVIKESYAKFNGFNDLKPLEVAALDEWLLKATIQSSIVGLLNSLKELKLTFTP